MHKTVMGQSRIHKIILGHCLCFWLASCSGAPVDPVVDARQWPSLRSQKGHFDGAGWNDAVDRWQGAKHRLMQQLAAQAWQERSSPEHLTALLGAPDQVLPAGSAPPLQVQWQQGTPAGDLWLYRWRGTHDQLVMALHAGHVVAVGWMYALE